MISGFTWPQMTLSNLSSLWLITRAPYSMTNDRKWPRILLSTLCTSITLTLEIHPSKNFEPSFLCFFVKIQFFVVFDQKMIKSIGQIQGSEKYQKWTNAVKSIEFLKKRRILGKTSDFWKKNIEFWKKKSNL